MPSSCATTPILRTFQSAKSAPATTVLMVMPKFQTRAASAMSMSATTPPAATMAALTPRSSCTRPDGSQRSSRRPLNQVRTTWATMISAAVERPSSGISSANRNNHASAAKWSIPSARARHRARYASDARSTVCGPRRRRPTLARRWRQVRSKTVGGTVTKSPSPTRAYIQLRRIVARPAGVETLVSSPAAAVGGGSARLCASMTAFRRAFRSASSSSSDLNRTWMSRRWSSRRKSAHPAISPYGSMPKPASPAHPGTSVPEWDGRTSPGSQRTAGG